MSAEARSALNRERGSRLWGNMTAEQRSELARTLYAMR